MMKLMLLTTLILTTASCTQENTNSPLPIISELNHEATRQLAELGEVKGLPSGNSKRLGIRPDQLVSMKQIEVTKVFKQNKNIMLVSRLSFESKKEKFFKDVILTYRDDEKIFKNLINHMILIPLTQTAKAATAPTTTL